MADDGMLLNFSIPETGILNKPKFKGGNWRDRLSAKKAAGHWHAKASGRLNGEDSKLAQPKPASTNANHTAIGLRPRRPSLSPEFERQPKRARVDGEFKPYPKDLIVKENV